MSLNAPEQAVPAVRTIPRRHVALALIVVAVILLIALVVVRNDHSPADTAVAETFTPAPGSLLSSVSTIPTSIVDAVGVTSPSAPTTAPTPTGNSSIWEASADHVDALPVVFFYGAEFAPYAAAERWPVVVALSRFGHFGQLGLSQSSSSEAFPDIASFTFWQSTYSSLWVTLQEVERYGSENPTGGTYTTLQMPDTRQAASVSVYDTSATTFPLLDVANHYILVGSSFAPSVLSGLTQAQIAADLAYPISPVTQAIVASANEITAAICTVTGQRPTPVCTTRGVDAARQMMGLTASG